MDLDDVLSATSGLDAQWSISIRRDNESTSLAEHEPARLLRTASVGKVFLLMELAGRLADGSIDAGQLVDRRTALRVHDSGIWHALRADRLPVVDLAVLVGGLSDNWATNALLDVCGLDRVQARAAATAPGGSMLHDYVRDDRSAAEAETLSTGCAGDWAAIMQRLYFDAAVGREVLAWLAQDADLSMVASAFDLDPLAHDVDDLGLRLWHKTGTDAGVRADVGVLRCESAVVSYAVICNWPADDRRPETRRAVLATMRGIGERIRAAIAES